jgi:hypothetical protein
LRLEYGEAWRYVQGQAPDNPVTAVQPFIAAGNNALCMIISRKGRPETIDDLEALDFVTLDSIESRTPLRDGCEGPSKRRVSRH